MKKILIILLIASTSYSQNTEVKIIDDEISIHYENNKENLKSIQVTYKGIQEGLWIFRYRTHKGLKKNLIIHRLSADVKTSPYFKSKNYIGQTFLISYIEKVEVRVSESGDDEILRRTLQKIELIPNKITGN